MGMHFIGGYADVISVNDVEKIAPVAFERLMDMTKHDVKEHNRLLLWTLLWNKEIFGIESVVEEDGLLMHNAMLLGDNQEERLKQYDQVFTELQLEFMNTTKSGEHVLHLEIGYHDKDSDGSAYDEVDGGFFCVNDCYVVSPAAKDLIANDIIKRVSFVTLC